MNDDKFMQELSTLLANIRRSTQSNSRSGKYHVTQIAAYMRDIGNPEIDKFILKWKIKQN